MTEHRDVADMIIATLRAHGVKRMFGVPGGGSSLDLIEADARHGIDFILTRTEAAATIAASVTGEMTGAPGAALVTKGPGTASAMNGFAYASLDRAPLVVFTDGFAEELSRYARHQFFDQMAMTAPVTKGHGRLEGTNPADEFARLVEATLTPPKGPVHIEITARAAQAPVGAAASPAPTGVTGRLTGDVEAARALLARSERPVIAVGLEARETREAAALERLVEALGCPVLTTYKAKGTIPHDDPRFVGIITNGAVEGACIEASDLLILYGLDPVEFISRPWRYDIPVLDLALWRHQPHYMEMEAGLYGELVEAAEALAEIGRAHV